MKGSDILIEAIKNFEGFRAEAYKDSAGVMTIGYGHTGNVKKGQKVSRSRAEELLRQDLRTAERYVNGLSVAKTQGEFDALTDFAYNLGTGALGSSTLLKRIREGASEATIRHEFERWVYAGGEKLRGLVIRRAWEADRFFQKS